MAVKPENQAGGNATQVPHVPILDELLLDTESPAVDSLFVCSVFEDQRPLKGVAGALDWRLRGFLSRFVMNGRISGAASEFVYVPIKHHGRIRSLMLVGLGKHSGPTNPGVLDQLANRIASLNFRKVTISRSSFPFLDETKFRRALKGVEVEFTQ